MASLETSLSRPQQSRILGCHEAENDFKDLNHRFFDFMDIALWAVYNPENGSHCLATTRKVAFLILRIRIFGWSRGRKKCRVPYVHLNIEFSTSTNSHFAMDKRPKRSSTRHGKEIEKDFKVPFDNMKHRFFDFNENVFWAGRVA